MGPPYGGLLSIEGDQTLLAVNAEGRRATEETLPEAKNPSRGNVPPPPPVSSTLVVDEGLC